MKLGISGGYIHFERPNLVQIQPYDWLWNIFKQTERLQVVSLWRRSFVILFFFVRTIIFANYSKCTLHSMLKMISISSLLGKAQLIHMKGSHFPLFFQKRRYKSVFLMVALMCSYNHNPRPYQVVSYAQYDRYPLGVYYTPRYTPLFCETLQLGGSHMLSWPAGWYERRAGAAPTCRIAFLAHRDLQLFLHICPRKSHSLSLSCPARVIWHLLIPEPPTE